jgi:hypothetical protein
MAIEILIYNYTDMDILFVPFFYNEFSSNIMGQQWW